MTEKKIGTCVKVLVNVGNYQNIEIAKYAETTITYESQEEMVSQEDKQTKEVLESLKRDMKKTPEELGKYEDKIEAFNNLTAKKMPTWLGEGAIPNIANSAKKVKEDAEAKLGNIMDKSSKDIDDLIIASSPVPAEKTKTIENTVTNKTNTEELNDLFGDDDLFDEN